MTHGMPLGVYVPGTTIIHQMPAGLKLVGLIAFVIGVTVFATTWTPISVAIAATTLGYLIARIPLRTAAGQVLPALPIVLFLGAFQWWQNDFTAAVLIVLSLMCTIAAAALLTLTTTIAALMESLERGLAPLARFGLPTETISLAMSLTIRLIPLQLAAVREVLDARAARGAGWSVFAFAVPVLVRSIRRARALGDALVARGVGE